MEKIINIIAIVVALSIVIYILTLKLPAGYHEKNEKGEYVPVQRTLL